MRRWRSIALAMAAGLVLMAQAQGVVRWLDVAHDFGAIHEEDGTVTCMMRLVNDGDSAMLITHVRTSCGCTVTEHPQQPIAPGDTAVVRVTYNPYNRPGQFSKDVFVYTNGSPRRTMVTISGNVISRPETLAERYPVTAGDLRLAVANVPLGELTRERRRSTYVTTYNASSTDTMLVDVQGAPAHIIAAATPDSLPPGAVGAISMFYDARRAPLWGLNVDSLAVVSRPLRHHGSAAQGGQTTINVMAQVIDDFSAMTDEQRRDAPTLVMSDEKLMFSAEQTVQTVTITNTGKNPLELRRLWTAAPGVAIRCNRMRIKRGKHATITVTVQPQRLEQKLLNDRMTIVSNDPNQPSATVRLVGSF